MTFNIIQQLGTPNKATTHRREHVARQEQIFILEYKNFVKCTPYDDHFVYESDKIGQSSFMCTCGSIAVVVQVGISPMLACHQHASSGFHATSIMNTKDIERGNVKILKGKKWS